MGARGRLEKALALFEDDWIEKYQYIIQLGRKMPPLIDEDKTEANKVDGCISQVWLKIEVANDKHLTFTGDSDSVIVKGLVAILHALLSDRPAHDILEEDIEGFFKRCGLEQHITPNRRNGFFSMVKEIRKAALVIDST
jgi:cysteine desulfuration protein SufE